MIPEKLNNAHFHKIKETFINSQILKRKKNKKLRIIDLLLFNEIQIKN